MSSYARHERETGANGRAGTGDEGRAFFVGEEEGFGVGTQDYEAGETGGGEVGVIFLLEMRSSVSVERSNNVTAGHQTPDGGMCGCLGG